MLRAALAGLAFVALPLSATAQELPKAEKHANVKWYRIVHVDFKPGKADDALKIVYAHFVPAANAAGLEPARILEHETGEWDVTYIFPLSEGPTVLEWDVTPNGEKFWAELAKKEGGADKALAVFAEYADMVARAESQIVRERG